jgi:hypothetical protein
MIAFAYPSTCSLFCVQIPERTVELEKRKESPLGEPTLPVGSSPQLTYKVGEDRVTFKTESLFAQSYQNNVCT